MRVSDVLTMDEIEKIVKEMSHEYDLPEPEVAHYEEPARSENVVQIWFKHNMRKHSVEVRYDMSARADMLDVLPAR